MTNFRAKIARVGIVVNRRNEPKTESRKEPTAEPRNRRTHRTRSAAIRGLCGSGNGGQKELTILRTVAQLILSRILGDSQRMIRCVVPLIISLMIIKRRVWYLFNKKQANIYDASRKREVRDPLCRDSEFRRLNLESSTGSATVCYNRASCKVNGEELLRQGPAAQSLTAGQPAAAALLKSK